MHLKSKPPRKRLARADHRAAAAEAGAGAGHPRLPAESAAHPGRRDAHQEPVPVHAAGPGHRGALQVRAPARSEDAQPAGLHRCHERPAAQEPAGQRRDRPRQGRRRRRDARRRSRTRSTRPTARGRSRPSTRRTTSTRSSWSCCPEYQTDPAALALLYVRPRGGRPRAARLGGEADARASGRSRSTTRASFRR